MAKNQKSKKQQQEKQQQQPKISMEELAAMSDSDDDEEMPPESEWNDQAKALKAAIESGNLEAALRAANDNDGDSFEEATLDSDDDEESSSDEGSGSEAEDAAAQEQEEPANDEDDDDDEKSNSSSNASDQESESEEDTKEAENQPEKEQQTHINEASMVKTKALRVVMDSLVTERKELPWTETFDIVPATALPFTKDGGVNIHDDLKREVAFYDNALEAVLEAKEKCREAGVPFSRPDDFFAEMVKTDGAWFEGSDVFAVLLDCLLDEMLFVSHRFVFSLVENFRTHGESQGPPHF